MVKINDIKETPKLNLALKLVILYALTTVILLFVGNAELDFIAAFEESDTISSICKFLTKLHAL